RPARRRLHDEEIDHHDREQGRDHQQDAAYRIGDHQRRPAEPTPLLPPPQPSPACGGGGRPCPAGGKPSPLKGEGLGGGEASASRCFVWFRAEGRASPPPNPPPSRGRALSGE